MKYLSKKNDSEILKKEWKYETKSQRPKIRAALLKEQKGFCAYSERYIQQTDSPEIEHFDPRIKPTSKDGYQNWYAVLNWLNIHKPKKIEPHLPILHPSSPDLKERILYKDGLFQVANKDDEEAQNLINFLGWNKMEVVTDRQKHVQRVKFMKEMLAEETLFLEQLKKDKLNLSFATALEAELGIDIDTLLT